MSRESLSASSGTFPIPDVIPIFPLPDVVFFPHTYLPLHIFEPRYRQMVADASTGGQCIGMALFKEGWEEESYENPPIFELGCVGRLSNVHKLPGGRFNIVLEGLQRCEYQELWSETRYRQAKIFLQPSFRTQTMDTSTKLRLTELAETYLRAKKADDLCALISSHKLSEALLVNCLSTGLDFTPLDKQFLLESDHLSQQARRLIDLLKFKLGSSLTPASPEADS